MDGPSVLARVDLFAELPTSELDALAGRLRWARYARGETIFFRGDPGSSLFIIETGRVKLALGSPDGKEFLLDLLGPGDFFGELALLDGEPRSADAMAAESCQLHLLQREDFLRFLDERPGVAIRLLRALSGRLRRDADVLEGAAFRDIPGRLARVLLRFAEATGEPVDGGLLIPARLTQSELAGMVGATRESANKWLRSFERQGLIRQDGRRITVLRPEALRDRFP